jgi:hypothetical protein
LTLFLLSLAVILLAVVGLAAGLLLGRGPLQASCGGDPAVRLCALCRREQDK